MNRADCTTTAVILLAGNAPRYLDAAECISCALLEVNGHSLLHCAVARLFQAGFCQVLLVTGQTSRAVQTVEKIPGVEVVYNALFADLGSMFALRQAAAYIPSYPFVLVESGLLFDSRLARLARTLPCPNAALVSTSDQENSAVLAAGANHRLLGLYSETRPAMAADSAVFASLGIYKISRPMFAEMLRRAAERTYTDPFFDYVECINEIAVQAEVAMVPVSDLLWTTVRNRAEATRALQCLPPHILQQENRWQ